MPRKTPDGRFVGIVTIALRPSYFGAFYRELLGEHSTVSLGLTRTDGAVLAWYPTRPPDRMERASLGLFINAGVLEESFSSAYFRFNDDTAKQLQSSLRPPEDAADFVTRNDATARLLAQIDAMRLCISFTSAPAVAAPGE